MPNQEIKNNVVNRSGTTSCEGVALSIYGVFDPTSAGCQQATYQTKKRMKWETGLNKIVIECWIKIESTKKYRERMKKTWDKIGVFPVTNHRLAGQARWIRKNKWLTDIEIEEIRKKLKQKIVKWKF